jgi:hypothetical protein
LAFLRARKVRASILLVEDNPTAELTNTLHLAHSAKVPLRTFFKTYRAATMAATTGAKVLGEVVIGDGDQKN